MSTRVGIIAEGPIDRALVAVLLERIAQDRADIDWPVDSNDVANIFQIRKRGHGGVLETVRKLTAALSDRIYDYSFYIIMLDRRTRPVQHEIRSLLSRNDHFILGIAIEEIEACWLADRRNTLAWLNLRDGLPDDCRYAQVGYQSERDPNPKKTLDELTRRADRFDRNYGEGNLDMAIEFAEEHWRERAHLNDLKTQCPRGYAPFERAVTQNFEGPSEARVVCSEVYTPGGRADAGTIITYWKHAGMWYADFGRIIPTKHLWLPESKLAMA